MGSPKQRHFTSKMFLCDRHNSAFLKLEDLISEVWSLLGDAKQMRFIDCSLGNAVKMSANFEKKLDTSSKKYYHLKSYFDIKYFCAVNKNNSVLLKWLVNIKWKYDGYLESLLLSKLHNGRRDPNEISLTQIVFAVLVANF